MHPDTKQQGTYYLVKWKGYKEKDNTWEKYEDLCETVPDLIVEFEDIE